MSPARPRVSPHPRIPSSAQVPDFKFTSIQVNKNYLSALHVDKNNLGPSYIVGVGDYTEGGLFVKDQGEVDCKHRWCEFDGNMPHQTLPYK